MPDNRSCCILTITLKSVPAMPTHEELCRLTQMRHFIKQAGSSIRAHGSLQPIHHAHDSWNMYFLQACKPVLVSWYIVAVPGCLSIPGLVFQCSPVHPFVQICKPCIFDMSGTHVAESSKSLSFLLRVISLMRMAGWALLAFSATQEG